MQIRPNTRKFANAIIDAAAPVVSSVAQKDKGGIGAGLLNSLYGKPQGRVKPPKLTRDETFTVNLFKGFSEIYKCIERLKDCETYISRFPFKGTRVSRDAYYQFVVEAHLHELYILRERLSTYSKQIRRLYRSDGNATQVCAVTKLLEEHVSTAFAGFARVRGSHVHQSRYANDDIERLGLIALLQKGQDKQIKSAIRGIGRIAIVQTHVKLKGQTKEWNLKVAKVLEEYFKALLQLVFKSDEKSLRFPIPKRHKS